MGTLTPTFADKQAQAQLTNGGVPDDPPRVVAAHEPLSRETWVPPAPQYLFAQPAAPSVKVVVPQPAAPLEPAPLKVALVGTAPSSRMLAPFNDQSWKIWGCSPGNMKILPRVDAWFEIHSNLMWPEHQSYGEPYIAWLKTLNVPVYMQDQSQVPNAITFPWRELIVEFGEDFFTSSFTWMMAFAMKQGAAEIALYGIDMASRDEYILQRPGFFFFRHLARQRGVKVTAPNESDIMQSPPLYAISDSTPLGRKIWSREKELKDRIAQISGQVNHLNGQLAYLQGALEDLDYFKSIWTGAQRPM